MVLKNVLQPLREMTTKLLKKDIDIRCAYTSLMDIKENIAMMRTDIDARFQLWYKDALDLAKELGTDERAKGRNIYRATHPSKSSREYF